MSAEIRNQRSERSEVRGQGAEVSRSAFIDRCEVTSPATLALSHPSPSHRIRVAARGGFSLVEMIVVIAIVVLLFALTIGVLTVLSRSAETRTTQDALSILDQAYEEWKRASERDVTYGKPDEPQPGMTYEILQDDMPNSPDGNDHEATDELIDIIHRSAPIRDILSKINSDLLQPPTPPAHDDIKMVDAWETEVITVHPGRQWVPADQGPYGDKDVDGTIRTEFENAFGFCTNRRVRFVSAGPDGKFGDLDLDAATPPLSPEAQDNIYSYPLEATP